MRCKACKEKDRLIESLQEQINWLREHNGTPSLTALRQQERKTDTPQSSQQQWVSEEEEELEAMQQAGLIDVSEAEAALAQLGALNTEIYVEG